MNRSLPSQIVTAELILCKSEQKSTPSPQHWPVKGHFSYNEESAYKVVSIIIGRGAGPDCFFTTSKLKELKKKSFAEISLVTVVKVVML